MIKKICKLKYQYYNLFCISLDEEDLQKFNKKIQNNKFLEITKKCYYWKKIYITFKEHQIIMKNMSKKFWLGTA